jgi:hypothetical protein
MDNQARIGRWMLIVVIAVFALGEVGLAAVNLEAGRFSLVQVGRVILTAWLLWRMWDGAAWARWLYAALSLAGAVLAFVAGFGSGASVGRPEVLVITCVFIAVSLGLTVAVASPFVGAYQEARSGER